MLSNNEVDLPTLGSIAQAMEGVEGYRIDLKDGITEAVAEKRENNLYQKVIVRVTPEKVTRTTILVEVADSLEELPTSCFAEW